MRGPVETKVAAGGGTGAILSLLFGLAAQYHWFALPSPYLTALTVTVLSFLAAWLARHTSRPAPPLTLPADEMQAVRAIAAWLASGARVSTSTGAGTPVVIQPSASTGKGLADPGPIETGKP